VLTPLLIANRGEIACRVAATARRLGIRTIAVYSDADAGSAHVAACDDAVRIGSAEPRESYLRTDAILQAARDTGARAIHPGYGFLSENAAFAAAVTEAGIVFVGPPASAIVAMGSKSAAKTLMEKAGVPLVPGYHGDRQEPEFLRGQADIIGYPVLIKASAGGGGKGMRVVESSHAFDEALASCKREAASSFGDERVLIERYLQKPRHIEIQIFADHHDHCVYLFERDCSVQRRHQKVIEEAPAPGMTPARRRAMGEAAVAAARAVGYVGAGTVEFIVEPDGRFYFMEMNTRLQVEHPVTEMITGHDLVEWQLHVAAGGSLPVDQQALHATGHAIEVRLYAENPANGFLPSIGTLRHLRMPAHTAFTNGDVRWDGGVRQGDTITPFYDPMIAKLIVRGTDREHARRRMLQALSEIEVMGVHTNVAFLARLIGDDAFACADLDTGLIERRHAALFAPPMPADALTLALAGAAAMIQLGVDTVGHSAQASASAASPFLPSFLPSPPAADPWSAADGWRIGGEFQFPLQWMDGDHVRAVTLIRRGPRWFFSLDNNEEAISWQRIAPAGDAADVDNENADACFWVRVRATLGRQSGLATVIVDGSQALIVGPAGTHSLTRVDLLAHVEGDALDHGGSLTAPMPGKILSISVATGASVKRGETLIMMEAMKMEHTITAPRDGIVHDVFYAVGDQVAEGAPLIGMAPTGPD
jgi:3-methylcrotonyl-CoA carboxylase alpha subunit